MLTRALVTRHAANRADAYQAALLDIAQDHLLYLLDLDGVLGTGQLIFKGGTSLRKFRLGNAGRFSTDLDFNAPDDDTVMDVCSLIDGAAIGGFTYRLRSTRGDGRRWGLDITHPDLGSITGMAQVEFARRPLALASEQLKPMPLAIHSAYAFEMPSLPVIAEAEACAEKLARYRRIPLARDLYDLNWFANRVLDERLVRRLWVLKVYGDVVDDSRGGKPLDPDEVLRIRQESDFPLESIGVLTQPVHIAAWERNVRDRFQFLCHLDSDEQRWAACNPRDHYEVAAALSALDPDNTEHG